MSKEINNLTGKCYNLVVNINNNNTNIDGTKSNQNKPNARIVKKAYYVYEQMLTSDEIKSSS
ncbi:MAG: hypothetical protein EOP34_11675 [Rickettsiales bacterium]|nr:MAG: hypothetical protein EOP34_11675 [Rickettsiales bacterium]